jgi:hypothetical protein
MLAVGQKIRDTAHLLQGALSVLLAHTVTCILWVLWACTLMYMCTMGALHMRGALSIHT